MATATVPAAMPPLRLSDVRLVREGRTILSPLSWTVREDERWIVLGANGSGKTTLIQIAALYLHPSSGTVEVLGETLGRCDVRRARALVAPLHVRGPRGGAAGPGPAGGGRLRDADRRLPLVR